jgi:small-conductance mechanosensitive channel
MDDLMDTVSQPYETFFENLFDTLPSLLLALGIVLTFVYFGWKLSRWLTHGFRGGKTSLLRVFFQRLIFLFTVFVGFVLILPIFGYTRIASFFLAAGSLIAVIFGIAFREIGQNILGGFLLAINRPFEIGDLICLGDFEGTVISLNLRTTHLRTYDGQDVFIPNTDFMQKPLVNYTRDGLRRFRFDIGLDYSNDAEHARTVILDAVDGIDDVLDDPSPKAIVQELATNAVIIRVYYWIDMFVLDPSLFVIRSNVINQVKEKLQEEGFDLPAEIVELQNADPDDPFSIRSQQ